jgi:alkaline phosphatase D
VVTEGTAKVAETLDEFRVRHQYNLLDAHVRAFGAEVAQLVQWDDHEVVNNWVSGKILPPDDARYRIKDGNLLAARAKHALFEWAPLRDNAEEKERIFRSFAFGPMLEVFMLDMRTYGGPNRAPPGWGSRDRIDLPGAR